MEKEMSNDRKELLALIQMMTADELNYLIYQMSVHPQLGKHFKDHTT